MSFYIYTQKFKDQYAVDAAVAGDLIPWMDISIYTVYIYVYIFFTAVHVTVDLKVEYILLI